MIVPSHSVSLDILRSRALSGLGMYPDETCFDTTRPSWLPYWIDDIVESKCKVNMLVSGNTTGNTAQSGTFTTDANGNIVSAADPTTILNAQAACAAQSGTWNATLQVCNQSMLSQLTTPLALAGVGLLALLLLMRK